MASKSSSYFILIIIFMTLMATRSSSLAQSNGSPTPSMEDKTRFSPFRPSMAVVVALLTTIFSITFLLLLYAKHCKRRRADANANAYAAADYYNNNDNYYQSNYYYYRDARLGRKNSGIDRAVVESLPVFRYGDLSGSRLQRGGLDCAVCLNRFEDSEILRLLPKCNHAFHVECVDTWLDAHSTCPLCRFQVDPEDVLLVVGVPPTVGKRQSGSGVEICSGVVVVDDDDDTIFRTNLLNTASSAAGTSNAGADGEFRRHSSAGEKMMQILDTVSFRRSLDGWKRSRNGKRDPSYRKDGLLLGKRKNNNISSISSSSSSNNNNRLEHRIVVSTTRPCESGPPSRQYYQRWSDVQPSDLLYLRSEMILSDSRRFSSVSGPRPSRHLQDRQLSRHDRRHGNDTRVVNSRSASEIAGVSRFSNDDSRAGNDTNQHQQQRQQQARLVSRWMAWISQLRPANNNDNTSNHHNISP